MIEIPAPAEFAETFERTEGKVPVLRRTLSGLAFVVVCFAAIPAMAQLTVCNESPDMAYVAVGYWDNTQYVSEGWWTAEAGACVVPYDGALEYQYYYVYAETDADKSGNIATWGGETMLCIDQFNSFRIWGDTNCETGFVEVDTGKSKEWMFTLQ
jgi:uncharacterized membrane protein